MAALVNDLNELINGATSRVEGATVSISADVAYFTIAAGATDTSPTSITFMASPTKYLSPTYAWYSIIGGVQTLISGEVTSTLVITGDAAWITALGTETFVQYKVVASEAGYNSAENIFNLPVLRDGVVGTSATTYWMITSAGALAKDVLGVFTPTTVTFAGKTATGTVTPTDYAGRFKIYENGSGTASYTSGADEISKVYTPSSSSVTSIKAELYLAGGVITMLDTDIVPVVDDGATGATATSYWVSSSAGAIRQTIANVYDPTTVIFYGYSNTGSGTPAAYAGRFKIYENGSGTASYSSVSNEASKVYTPSSTSVTSIKVELYLAGGFTTKVDEEIIPIVSDGSNAITVDLSNSNKSLSADYGGTVAAPDYANSGTTIQVYEGGTLLTYRTTLGSNVSSFTIGTPTQSPTSTLTVGSISGNLTTTATVANHSAMVTGTDAVLITYPITYNRADGTSGTTSAAVQSITKVRNGTNGLSVVFSNPVHPVTCDSAGTVTDSYAGSGTTIQVFDGGGSPLTITACTKTGTNITPGSSSGLPSSTLTIGTHSAITANTATISYALTVTRADGTSASITDRQVVYKNIAGASALNGFLTKGSPTVSAAADGTGYSLTLAGGTFEVWLQGVSKTTSSTYAITGGTDNGTNWSKTQNGLTLTIQESGASAGQYTLSGASWTSTSEQFTLTGTYNGSVITQVYIITKATQGAAGDKTALVTLYQWAYAPPSLPVAANTTVFTWSPPAAVQTGSSWTVAIPTDTTPGKILYSITKSLTVAGSTTTTTIYGSSSGSSPNWTGIVPAAIAINGDETLRCYGKYVGNGAVPSGTVTTAIGAYPDINDFGVTSPTWVAGFSPTDTTLTSGQTLWLCDGITNSSNQVVWGTPYLSTFKVGSLEALSATLGSVNSGNITTTTFTGGTIQTSATTNADRIIMDSTGFRAYNWDGSVLTQRVNINVDGSGWLGTSTALSWDNLGVITATGVTVRSGSTTTRVELTSSGIKGYNSGVQRFNVDTDGAGWLGSSNGLFWTNAGVITATGVIVQSNATTTRTELTSVGIKTYSGGVLGVELNDTGFKAYNSGTQRVNIASDGSGWLGSATALAWTSAGVLTATGITVQTAGSGARTEFAATGIKGYDATTQRYQLSNDGSGWFGSSTAFAWTSAGVITSTGITVRTAASGARVEFTPTGIKGYDATTQRYQLSNDGSGWFGSSTTFAWTSAGVVTATGLTIRSATSGTRLTINDSSNNRIEVYDASVGLLGYIGGTITSTSKYTVKFQGLTSSTWDNAAIAGLASSQSGYKTSGFYGTIVARDGDTAGNPQMHVRIASIVPDFYSVGITAESRSGTSGGDGKWTTFNACYRNETGSDTHGYAGYFDVTSTSGSITLGKFEILDTAYEVKLTAAAPTFKLVSSAGGSRTWSTIGGDTWSLWTTGPSVAAISVNSVNLVTLERLRLIPLTAAPSGLIAGMLVSADRVTWDPAAKGSGGAYPVYYNGSTWTALY